MDSVTTSQPWLGKVEEIASKVAEKEGCLLYDLEFTGTGAGRTLRLFIDKEPGGVGIEECSSVSNGLNEALDQDDIIPGGPYHLEVSSPGLDRILRKSWHFAKVVGKKVSLKTKEPLETYGVTDKKWLKAKQVEFVLENIDGEVAVFKPGAEEIRIPLNAVEKAKLVFELTKGKKK